MIAFNYQEAMRQSRELEQISDNIKDLAEKFLRSGQSGLRISWTGDSAELFYQKTEELYKDIKKTANNMAKISNTVHSTAKAIKAAEDAAKELIDTVKL